jgi:hypothetical protein
MDVPQEMVQALEDNRDGVLSIDGVRGLEIGLDESGEGLAFRILVPDPSSPPGDLPQSIGNYPVLVIAGDPTVGGLPDLASYDPVVGGIEVCRTTGTPVVGAIQLGPGTLACIVRDAGTEELRGLSCAHVLCGDVPSGGFAVGDTIDQPAPTTLPPPATERLGDLLRWSYPQTPPLFPGVSGTVPAGDCDAAICTVDRNATAFEVAEIGTVQGWGSASLGDAVRKRGKVTGLTYGVVAGVLGSYLVYDSNGAPLWWMLGQIRIDADPNHPETPTFCLPGDSGSLIVNEAGQAVALFWGGDSATSGVTGFGTDIFTVISELSISFT